MKVLIAVIGAFFITSCAVSPYTSQAQCKSNSGKECQQACKIMACSDFSSDGCFSKGDNWDWFLDLKDPGAYHLKSAKTKRSFLMMKKDGDMYLVMNGNLNHIQPGYGLSATIVTPPENHPYFRSDTYSALVAEGFQCTGTLNKAWIPEMGSP